MHHMESVLGKELIGASGEKVGRVVDVLADDNGQVRAAIIDFGGFLGVGSRKIAISWSDLHFAPDGSRDSIAVDLSRDHLSQAPEVKDGQPVVVVSARRPFWNRAEARK